MKQLQCNLDIIFEKNILSEYHMRTGNGIQCGRKSCRYTRNWLRDSVKNNDSFIFIYTELVARKVGRWGNWRSRTSLRLWRSLDSLINVGLSWDTNYRFPQSSHTVNIIISSTCLDFHSYTRAKPSTTNICSQAFHYL